MYRLQEVQAELIKRIGFRQTTDPRVPKLAADLLRSDSGIYVQDRHPLLNTNNLFMAAENFAQYPYAEWVHPPTPADNYAIGAFVRHDNETWRSKIANNAVEPTDANAAEWENIDNFSDYLMNIQKQSIQATVEKLFQNKKLERNTKSIFENIFLFDGAGNSNFTIIKYNRFVGFKINLRLQKHMTILIRKIGTQFSGMAPDLDLYLYHSSQVDPIALIPINHNKPGSFKWSDIDDIMLPYVEADQDAGGSFYLGYYEEDLPVGVLAIRKDNYDWRYGPCSTCPGSQGDRMFYQKWSAYMNIAPFIVNASDLDPDRKLFNQIKVGVTYDTNWGLNLHLTAKCDLTDFIIENSNVFDEAYADQLTYQFLQSFMYTLRDNGDGKQTRDLAGYEMQRQDGLAVPKKLDSSFKALDFDMSGFNSVCLPCNRPKGARTGAMI